MENSFFVSDAGRNWSLSNRWTVRSPLVLLSSFAPVFESASALWWMRLFLAEWKLLKHPFLPISAARIYQRLHFHKNCFQLILEDTGAKSGQSISPFILSQLTTNLFKRLNAVTSPTHDSSSDFVVRVVPAYSATQRGFPGSVICFMRKKKTGWTFKEVHLFMGSFLFN